MNTPQDAPATDTEPQAAPTEGAPSPDAAGPAPDAQNVAAMMNVALSVQIVLGQTRLPISQLLSLSRGSVVELDKRIGEPVDMMINDRLVARGDLVKVADNRLGVALTEIIKDFSEI